MPYPVVHVLFFLFCVGAAAVFAITKALSKKELTFKNSTELLLIVYIGSMCTLFPDLPAVYNLFTNGTLDHISVGSIPTHSILFSVTAVLFGTAIEYALYRKVNKALYMGVFAESAFLTHLLLDDIVEGGCPYLYPLYDRKISVFSIMDTGFADAGSLSHYLAISVATVFCVFIVIIMALFALNKFGFEFNYKVKK